MKKMVITSILLIALIFLIIILTDDKDTNVSILTNDTLKYDKYNEEDYYGFLRIPSIMMNLGFYNYGHELNDVSKNVQYIPIPVSNSYLLAAHSGVGKIAYFNDLRYVNIGDDVYLEIAGEEKHYKINDIYRTIKDGDINISQESGMLYLTTCDQIIKGYQLVVEASECT